MVNESPSPDATWSVAGGTASTIAGGLLSVGAGETATSLTVTATSTTDLGKFGTATVGVAEAVEGGDEVGDLTIQAPW
jgi:hypothetical protein